MIFYVGLIFSNHYNKPYLTVYHYVVYNPLVDEQNRRHPGIRNLSRLRPGIKYWVACLLELGRSTSENKHGLFAIAKLEDSLDAATLIQFPIRS
jgi:hypothetical protein